MRQAMRRVLETEGFVTEVFSNAEDFLATDAASRARCLVLDIRLPGMSGIDLYRHLSTRHAIPTVFVTARDELRASVVKGVDCLLKPFAAQTLVQAVSRCITT